MSPHSNALATSPAPLAPVRRPLAPAPRTAPRPEADRIVALLHESHGAELLRFCRWMLRDSDEAHDALQDTWIRALAALRDDRVGVAAHRPWLFAIARNVCLDRLRERGRMAHEEVDEEALGGGPAPDEVLSLRDEAGAALAMVGALPERQRAALLMREVAGMSMVEIAGALGVTVERAHWAIADARRSLEDTRSGSRAGCDDVRSRLIAGHRGRTVRAHLEGCAACRKHDRRADMRRLLSPFALPALWLRDLWSGAALNPAAAATVALAIGTAVHPPAVRPVPAAPPARIGAPTAPTHRSAVSRPSADEPVRRATARDPAPRPAAVAGPPQVDAPRVPVVADPAVAPVPAARPAEPTRADAEPGVALPAPVRETAESVREVVRTVAPAALPLAGEVAGNTLAVADEALRQAGAVLEPVG